MPAGSMPSSRPCRTAPPHPPRLPRAGRTTALPAAAAASAAANHRHRGAPLANGHAHDSAALPPTYRTVETATLPAVATAVETINGRVESAPLQAVAVAVETVYGHVKTAAVERSFTAFETIDAGRPADLAEALALVGEGVTASGNQPLALDDPGAFWRVTSGQIDVFYLGPHSGHDAGRRHHLCRVEEGGSMLGSKGSAVVSQAHCLPWGSARPGCSRCRKPICSV